MLNQQGQYKAALPYHERAVSVFEASLGADHEYTGVALTALGEARAAIGDATALEPLERALAILEGKASTYLPDTRFALARALWTNRQSRPRALALARAARSAWKENGNSSNLREVESWLGERAGL